MRSLTFTAPDGEEHTLAATFDASVEIAKKVADPLYMVREAIAEATIGMAYQPKFRFSVENVPVILHVGMKAAQSTMTLRAVQNLVFDIGFYPAKVLAEQYIRLMVEAPQIDIDTPESDTPPGE